jgi:hypothetical protein
VTVSDDFTAAFAAALTAAAPGSAPNAAGPAVDVPVPAGASSAPTGTLIATVVVGPAPEGL